MFRQVFLIFLMGTLLIGAAATGTSFPVLLFMAGLILMAIAYSSLRDEQRE